MISKVNDDHDAKMQARYIVEEIDNQDCSLPFTKEQLLTIARRAENIARWARKEAKG